MIHNRKVTALIPIKEHSERVKNKNFRPFNGKPLYHHILETFEKTYAVDAVIIDTDSYIVINEAPKIFPKVITFDRPVELRGDFVSVNKIIEYDIQKIKSDIYIQSHATNPLLKAETIALALKKYIEVEENDYDSLFSVNSFQSRFYKKNGEAINHNPEELLRTQDLEPVFEENSNFYIFTEESFKKKNRRIGLKPYMYEMSKIEAIDIDDEFSFKLAEILALYSYER
jgi:CMP-N-acetylneuraminic acid synthetase